MDQAEIKAWKTKIPKMSHEEMARLWRFAPPGHIIFNSTAKDEETGQTLFDIFNERFISFGGMTPEISKKIGL